MFGRFEVKAIILKLLTTYTNFIDFYIPQARTMLFNIIKKEWYISEPKTLIMLKLLHTSIS